MTTIQFVVNDCRNGGHVFRYLNSGDRMALVWCDCRALSRSLGDLLDTTTEASPA